MSVSEIKLIELPKVCDPRGNLSFIENGTHLPFDIARVYWIYDVPGDAERFGHDDGGGEQRFHLARSYYGLLVPPMTWRRLDNFSTNSVAMVLSSTLYDQADYIEDYEQFKRTFKTIVNNGER